MRRYYYIFYAMLSAFMLFSCSPRTMGVSVNVMMPAGSDEASRLREIAVMPMPTPNGQNFAGEIESIFTSVKVDDKPYYTLVDRSILDKVMGEMNLSASGITDNNVAVSIGKLVGAKGIITGQVNDNHSSSESYTELRYYTECAAYSYVTGPYNSQIPVCVNWVQKSYSVNCVKRSAVFAFSVKLIEVETGQVIYASSPSSYQEDKGCSDQRAAASGDQLLITAKNIAKDTFRRDIAPYYAAVNMGVMVEPEGIKKSDNKKTFLQGVDYAKARRLDRACEIWQSIGKDEITSFAVVYNLGVCAEASGDFDKALELYKASDKIIGKPDNMVTSSLNRVNNLIENRKKLQKQRKN